MQLGSRNLIVRAYDRGMTSLHSSATITVHVSRQSNLPPEIISSNITLTVFRDSSGSSSLSLKTPINLLHTMISMKSPKTQDYPLIQVTVRDRTSYDQLFFELIPDPSTTDFVIDRYDGSIFIKPTASELSDPIISTMASKDPSFVWLEPALPKISSMAQLNSGDYRLLVKVTNGSLSSSNTIFLKVGSQWNRLFFQLV